MLTVGLSCTLLFSSTTIDQAVTQQRHAGLKGELAITGTGPGLRPRRWSTCAPLPECARPSR
jgi:hypothetical protein